MTAASGGGATGTTTASDGARWAADSLRAASGRSAWYPVAGFTSKLLVLSERSGRAVRGVEGPSGPLSKGQPRCAAAAAAAAAARAAGLPGAARCRRGVAGRLSVAREEAVGEEERTDDVSERGTCPRAGVRGVADCGFPLRWRGSRAIISHPHSRLTWRCGSMAAGTKRRERANTLAL